ncbi:hypothetical protein AQUCO_04100205v1 [Aquilegia coerulea]|uniref:Uncharacterized protein n=2 Tax=Aquilegia coerulea TaxID=218851 RepID=A0A2G5CQV3_AQUCA|nr:hypothetical protein AQUCO_04100205v1 [Aquilegia coerulea]
MEMELMEGQGGVKSLGYKIKGMSRESPTQKAIHILDNDLRTHWSTGTNTKEWILLELDQPCLLSQLRIYNKSVLEWEIALALRYKPEAFVKVRPRCEAPRRDMIYPINYTPCRYVRISCLRGNPIAIFFIQLIGVPVPGLEPEFQPVVNHLLPHILAHKQDAHNIHLLLLQDMAKRLVAFLPQLEADLTCFSEAAESITRFLALIAGPLYPILHIVGEREAVRASASIADSDISKNTQAIALTVSSNFEAQSRRSRSPSPFVQPAASFVVFRPEVVFILLRRAYKDSHLGIVCRTASRILEKLVEPGLSLDAPILDGDPTGSVYGEATKVDASNHMLIADYSVLFGEEFKVSDDQWDSNYVNVLDVGAVEEGILHVLYACASHPILCRKLADNSAEFWSVLPLVQALLPALRPPVSSPDHVDDSFSQWKQPYVQQALSQIVASSSSSSVYRPLLHVCAGYLSSFSPSHAKTACVLIDLCSGPLAPWISTVIAKVDLTIELLEELLGTIQSACHSITRAQAALKYIILALSGHMDDVLARYKEVKHKILFLVEMLEPFLDPAITSVKNTIAFGNVSTVFLEKQQHTCALALNVIRTAVKKPSVLPSLESEWRRGSVAPSVLLSILGPSIPLPPEIDLCKCPVSKDANQEASTDVSTSSVPRHAGPSSKPNDQEDPGGKTEVNEQTAKINILEDAGLLFAPLELKNTPLRNISNCFHGQSPEKNSAKSSPAEVTTDRNDIDESDGNNQSKSDLVLDVGFSVEYFNLQADFLQLMNHRDCELRASEFRRLALELHSQNDITPEGHDAAIDAFLLAAECYVNPFFMKAFRDDLKINEQLNISGTRIAQKCDVMEMRNVCGKKNSDLEVISHLERKRDMTVLQILLEAAELDREYHRKVSSGNEFPYDTEGDDQGIQISSVDKLAADAVTLVRQNQALLCRFLIYRLQKEQHSMHEILMQSLLFLLHSDPEKVHGVQRRWVLLQRLVIASTGGCEGPDVTINYHRFQYRSLIPTSSWMQKIHFFSSHSCPLVRFLGWMAISCYAKQYLKEQLFLGSNLVELTCLLSIFADELAQVDDIVIDESTKLRHTEFQKDFQVKNEFKLRDQLDGDKYFNVLYPDLYKFFPNMKKQFEAFGNIILEAVGLQLRSLPSCAIPDVLCWFSDVCLWPFIEKGKDGLCTGRTSDNFKGYAAKNAKAIILYILEAILLEHMEAMVPEIPKVVQVLVSLCRASYCDVAFLDSILSLLKPLISYALKKISDDVKLLEDESTCLNFESLCFNELLKNMKYRTEYRSDTLEKLPRGALTIFILGAVFPDLSCAKRKEILLSLIFWADFTNFELPSSFHDYLCAFHKIMESCGMVLIQTLQEFGIPISMKSPHITSVSFSQGFDSNSELSSCFLDDICHVSPAFVSDQLEDLDEHTGLQNTMCNTFSSEEIVELCKCLEDLISKLYPAMDLCWKLHPQLAKKLTLISSRCFMFTRCLASIVHTHYINDDMPIERVSPANLNNHNSVHWRSGLEGLAEAVLNLQENHCWAVASVVLDYVLALPQCFYLDYVLGTICSGIKLFICRAPRILWRLQTDKWLSILLRRGIGGLLENAHSLVDLFCTMLAHPEPEQRSIALQHLSIVVGQDAIDAGEKLSNTLCDKLATPSSFPVPESVLSLLVSRTWERVVLLSSSDPSMLLRIRAMALLINYIPFADREKLQSFLVAADRILQGLGKLSYSVCESPLTQLSLALLAAACLHSHAEDISLIPQNIWSNLEILGMSNSGGKLGDMEKKACQALCKLRVEEDNAKVVLKELLSPAPASKQGDVDFGTTRDSILEVMANLTSVQTYFDMFSQKNDKAATELEEAEIEMELLQKEQAMQELSGDYRREIQQPPIISPAQMKDDFHLQRIKDGIQSYEKSQLREEIVARRQKKLLVRRARQKYLEDAALREAELLQGLDRERTSEVEREIERQRLLELERAKTRELRYNLDLEKERQTQRELQRELEQADSGLRPSRRELSSTTSSSRSRDRFRERENGRPAQEGSSRPSSSGRESGVTQPMTSGSTVISGLAVGPTVVLGGSRPYSSQLPTILQSRDRSHERDSSYEDNYDGSKDSGDTGSAGDPDLASAFDGVGSYGSLQRPGSRGSKSRQVTERREHDGRRGGKWERKQS